MSDYHFIKRQFVPAANAIDTFAALSADGTNEGAVLLETADGLTPDSGKSLLMLSPCVRVDGFHNRVSLTPLTPNGQCLVSKMASNIEAAVFANDALIIPVNQRATANSETERLQQDSALSVLRVLLQSFFASHDDERKLFQLTGVFHFETVEMFEQFESFDSKNTPLNSMNAQRLFRAYLPEVVISIPRANQPVSAYALVVAGVNAQKIENDMSRRLVELIDKLNQVKPTVPAQGLSPDEVEIDVSDETFVNQVSSVKEHLRAGDAFQIVISRRFFLPCKSALASYRVLRQENPSPYLFYVNMGDSTLIGASPESAVKVNGLTREVEVCPIAGTRARGRNRTGDTNAIDVDFDARIEADLRADEKEVAEHMMLVDLARNDVARISSPGTRQVKQLLTVERYSRVMHLVSRVAGRLKPELDALHAYAASMPMGTLSGAPKIRAIQIIRQIEQKSRGAYGGAVGYINAQGDMDTAIVIRAAVISEGRACVQAGAGVVLASDPMSEADETRRKAESVLRAIHGANHA